jgi:hypothetical protein
MMFKFASAALALSVLGTGGPGVRFEADGVRVGGQLVQGRDIRVVEAMLVSGAAVEPLTAAVEIAVGGSTLVLEPGVRAERVKDGIALTVHGKKWIRAEAKGRVVFLGNATIVRATETGWDLGGGRALEGAMRVRVQQDDPDKNLEAMKEAARKAEEAMKPKPPQPPIVEPPVPPAPPPQPPPPAARARARRVFGDDPIIGSDPGQLPPVSPFGN